MNKEKIIIISGPTASGKSDLAVNIALKLDGVVINADSMQVYKNLPILSAQPTESGMFHVKHFLYSILNHDEESSVALWLDMATKIINEQILLGKTPVIVGGTGLYISRLIDGIAPIPDIDEKIRQEARVLFDEIEKRDFIKEIENIIGEEKDLDKLDKQRLIRFYEVAKQTGKSLRWWQKQANKKFYSESQFVHMNLDPLRDKLYDNCNLRFKKMLDEGGVDEVKNFIKLKPLDQAPITKTIGYFEIKDYLEGFIDKDIMIEKSCQKTRNYAKRQLTWFRNQFENKIVLQEEFDNVDKILQKIECFT